MGVFIEYGIIPMAKAINWPAEFYDEVMSEDCEASRVALRPDSLYYDNGYYTVGEVVDIRVDHKAVRKAVIIEEMSVYKISELPEEILSKYRQNLRYRQDVISYLSRYYGRDFDENSTVTVIQYKNLQNKVEGAVDDPHMS